MNFNYDLVTWINYCIGALACCIGMCLINKILLKKSFKDIKLIRFLLIIPFTIFIILNTLTFDNILKLFGSLFILALINIYILQERGNKIFIYSVISYIIFLLAEMIFALIISLSDYIFNNVVISEASKMIYTNISISIIACLIAYLLREKINTNIDKINKDNFFIILLQFILTLIVIISSINFLYLEKFKFSYKFILIFITIFGSSMLTFTLLRQYIKRKEVITKYNMLEEYLKTSADLIEKYSSTVHKYKNNLIVIKGYIKSDIPSANNYIDGLLEKMEDKKYSWVKKINYIPIDSIRYIIYYKLSKAEEMNLNIYVNVSKDIKLLDPKFLKSHSLGHILDILGEYFDNAIYASYESNDKKLYFDSYITNKQLIFDISNTFKNKVDLNLINKNGYTTKGKGHGLGLYDVDKTIKNINELEVKYELIDNCFKASLIIKIK